MKKRYGIAVFCIVVGTIQPIHSYKEATGASTVEQKTEASKAAQNMSSCPNDGVHSNCMDLCLQAEALNRATDNGKSSTAGGTGTTAQDPEGTDLNHPAVIVAVRDFAYFWCSKNNGYQIRIDNITKIRRGSSPFHKGAPDSPFPNDLPTQRSSGPIRLGPVEKKANGQWYKYSFTVFERCGPRQTDSCGLRETFDPHLYIVNEPY
jgi:hypothetical protein